MIEGIADLSSLSESDPIRSICMFAGADSSKDFSFDPMLSPFNSAIIEAAPLANSLLPLLMASVRRGTADSPFTFAAPRKPAKIT